MRTGAIFARGSCRALQWMALFGVVFALGAGQAWAQTTTIGIRSISVTGAAPGNVVTEGDRWTVVVALDKRVPRTEAGGTSVTIDLTEGALATGTTLTADVDLTTGLGSDTADAAAANKGNAELADVVLANTTIVIGEQQSSGSAVFLTGRDLDAVDEKFVIRGVINTTVPTGVAIGAANFKGFSGKIDDTEGQGYEFELDTDADDVKEGEPFDLQLRAVPPRPRNEEVTVYLQRSNILYTFAGDHDGDSTTDALPTPNVRELAYTDPVAGIPIRVTTPGNDRNRTDDTVMIEAFTGQTGRSAEATTIDVMVADAHMLPDADAISAVARDDEKYADGSMITSVMEGGKTYIWVMVENTLRDQVADDEKFSVSLNAANTAQALDFKVTPSSITVPARDEFTLGSDDEERVGPFTLEALMDQDIGAERLMLSIDLTSAQPELVRGAGSSSGSFSIDIEDATTPMVSAKSDAEIQEAVYAAKGDGSIYVGDSFEVMTSDLFNMAEGVMVTYAASSDSAAVSAAASASTVTVTGVEAGMAHVTVTATATMAAGAKALPQTMSNIAQIIFPVEVMTAPITYSVMGPDDMNLAEGMSAMVTVMASGPVSMNTEVMLMRDGASSAGMDDFSVMPEMATIMVGEMMAEFEVMATEDMMMEDMEMLTLFLVVGDMQMTDMSVSFYLWDAAVPALPIIAQLLLAAFLAIGGYRRYLRR